MEIEKNIYILSTLLKVIYEYEEKLKYKSNNHKLKYYQLH